MADLTANADSVLKKATTVGRPSNFYPSPFFDLARTYLPDTIKETFDWCAYYFTTNPIINGVTSKLASYAITDLIYPSDPQAQQFKDLFEGPLHLRTVLIEHNLDRAVFGNAFMSVVFPFQKHITCTKCKDTQPIDRADYKWRSGQFHLTCKKCDETCVAKTHDETLRAPHRIRLIRWSPRSITIKKNELTGECRYFYTVPRHLKNELQLNSRRVVERTPQAFLDALSNNKLIELDAGMLFHSKRPSISRNAEDTGWGVPLILPVLKDLFLLQVLKKSQEAVMMEYMLPFRSVFPEIRADGNNVYANINLKDWQKEVKEQITQWKKDAAHIAVFPVPIGQQVMGGQGRSLLLHQEIRIYSDQIIAGLGIPTGFFYGDAQYSGANVNMRALENEFITNRDDMQHLVEFIIKQIARGLNLEIIQTNFKPFKMADDMQRVQLAMNLAAQNRISWRTVLEGLDYDVKKENDQIKEEMDEMGRRQADGAKNQAAAQAAMMQGQTSMQLAQQAAQQRQMALTMASQPPPPPAPPGMQQSPIGAENMQGAQPDMQGQAQQMAQQLGQMDEVSRYRALAQVRQQSPDLYQLVNKMLSEGNSPDPRAMKPLPEKLPPRRGPGSALV